jgi:prophage antirepressor-like protein
MTTSTVHSFPLPVSLGAFPRPVNAIRAVEIDGNPWFVAADVCKALGLAHHAKNGFARHLAKISPDQITTLSNVGVSATWRGSYSAKLVSESGLYKLIMRSDKPIAAKFQNWVTRDVLPAIRKDGAYVKGEEKVARGELSEDEFVLRALEILQGKVARLRSSVPKAAVCSPPAGTLRRSSGRSTSMCSGTSKR